MLSLVILKNPVYFCLDDLLRKLGARDHALCVYIRVRVWKVFALYPITVEHRDQIYRGIEASEILRHYWFHESRWAKKRDPINVLVERKTAAGAEPLLGNSETA